MSVQLASLLIQILNLVIYVVIARALLSWFITDPANPIMRFLSTLTDPLLKPFQKILTFGSLDVSPIVVIGICWGLQQLIVMSVAGAAMPAGVGLG